MRDLTTVFVEACQNAAIACHPWIGKGNKEAADAAAVEAMRAVFNASDMDGRIVIGEGERDEAPMLFIGENVGTAANPAMAIDIAVDPLEGTTLCAEDRPGAICVAAFAPRGELLCAPDVYMKKIAVGPGCTLAPNDLEADIVTVAERVATELGKSMADLKVCLLQRPRHQAMIDALSAAGVGLALITDGDVVGALRTALEDQHPASVDLYVGTGGAPEGVLAATGLSALGGQMLGQLQFKDSAQRQRAQDMGLADPDQVFTANQLAGQNGILVATGVTSGELLSGVVVDGSTVTTQSMVISHDGIQLI